MYITITHGAGSSKLASSAVCSKDLTVAMVRAHRILSATLLFPGSSGKHLKYRTKLSHVDMFLFCKVLTPAQTLPWLLGSAGFH